MRILNFLSLTLLLCSPVLYSQNISETNVVLIGDSGRNNPGQASVSLAMQELCSREDCNLGILAGDNVYPAGVTSSKDKILETVFDKFYNPLNFPFLIALGNHDYGKYYRSTQRASYQLLHAKRNPSFVIPHFWYTYETAEAVFAVIDTTRMMWAWDITVQANMVKKAHASAKAQNKWFMVVGHHPFLSNGPHGNAGRYSRTPIPYFISGRYVKNFMLANVCGKADFYLAGHDHSLQLIDGKPAGCNTQLIVSGTAASASKLSLNRNRAKFQSLELGFFHLSIQKDAVRVRAFNDKTNLLFEESYNKAANNIALIEI